MSVTHVRSRDEFQPNDGLIYGLSLALNPIRYDGLVMVLALAFFVGYQSRGKFFDFQGQFFELVAFQCNLNIFI